MEGVYDLGYERLCELQLCEPSLSAIGEEKAIMANTRSKLITLVKWVAPFLALPFVASSAWAQGSLDTSVSSDGVVGDIAFESATVSTVSPAFKGTGKINSQESGASTAAPDVKELMALKPVTAEVGTESIIGPDTRIRTYTTYYPARAVALITFSGGRCTGWFIGKDTVVTAGHCVHSGGSGGNWYSRTSYKVYPGYNQNTAPYGYCTAKRLHSVTGWTQSDSENYDYGAVKLNCTVGNTVGWFGFFWQTASLTNYPAIVSGYPGDKPLQQWWSSDTIRYTGTYQLFYRNDSIGGMSGSPVWYDRNGPYAMAIHAYGLHGSSPHNAYNHGTRITQGVFNNLIAWRNAL